MTKSANSSNRVAGTTMVTEYEQKRRGLKKVGNCKFSTKSCKSQSEEIMTAQNSQNGKFSSQI